MYLLSSTCMHLPFIPTVAQLLSTQNIRPRRMQFLSVCMESQTERRPQNAIRTFNVLSIFFSCIAIQLLASLLQNNITHLLRNSSTWQMHCVAFIGQRIFGFALCLFRIVGCLVFFCVCLSILLMVFSF